MLHIITGIIWNAVFHNIEVESPNCTTFGSKLEAVLPKHLSFEFNFNFAHICLKKLNFVCISPQVMTKWPPYPQYLFQACDDKDLQSLVHIIFNIVWLLLNIRL